MWINCSAIVWRRFNFECFPFERTRVFHLFSQKKKDDKMKEKNWVVESAKHFLLVIALPPLPPSPPPPPQPTTSDHNAHMITSTKVSMNSIDGFGTWYWLESNWRKRTQHDISNLKWFLSYRLLFGTLV